ncbi:MAG: exodeoxyribonuclease VII small subunit [Alphaproteobacteria bacterium]
MKNSLFDIDNITYEEAISELEAIVKKLENGKDSLEDSINYYEKAHALRKHCLKKLQEARLKVEKIIEKSDGTLSISQENVLE